MNKSKRLMTGSFLGVVNFFATTLVSLYMMPFLILHLGNRMYGLWLLLGAVFGFYGLLDLGLGSAVQRYMSRALGTNDYEEVNSVVNNSLIVFSLIGIASLIISFGAAMLGHLFLKDPSEIGLFRMILIMTGLTLAIGFPMRSFWAIFSSHLRWDLSIYVDLVKLVIRTFLIIVFIGHGYKLFAFAMIMFLTDVAGYIACFFISLRIAPYLRFSFTYLHKPQIKKLFHYSVYSFIANVSGNIKFNIDNFVIAGFMGLSPVTLYSVAARLIGYYRQFLNNAVGIVMPIFSQWEGQNDFNAIREKFWFMIKISGYLSCLVAGMLFVFGRVFILRWVGAEYVSAYEIMLILLFATSLDLMQSPAGQMLYGISKHKFLAVTGFLEALANLILSLIFVRSYGIAGVALGTAIPMLVVKIFILPAYTCRQLKISFYKYIGLLLKIILISWSVIAVERIVLSPFIKANYLSVACLSLASVVFFFIIIYFGGFDRQEKEYLQRVFNNTFLKWKNRE
ncbi:MAG: oligosaccharide flippase family protein [Candidatus Omnitrophica bacterium]|nr:oligosaccharide flippase family protein [Candidatus Omnitrophota bacterium]